MSKTRIAGLLSFVAGAAMLAVFVLARVSGDVLATYPLTRLATASAYITEQYLLPNAATDVELLLVVDRNVPNEQNQSYPHPSLRTRRGVGGSRQYARAA